MLAKIQGYRGPEIKGELEKFSGGSPWFKISLGKFDGLPVIFNGSPLVIVQLPLHEYSQIGLKLEFSVRDSRIQLADLVLTF